MLPPQNHKILTEHHKALSTRSLSTWRRFCGFPDVLLREPPSLLLHCHCPVCQPPPVP